MRFEKLGLKQKIVSVLNEKEFIRPTPVQEEVIPLVLAM